MSATPPNYNKGNQRFNRRTQYPNQRLPQGTAVNPEQLRIEPLFSSETDFPPLGATTTRQTAVTASSVNREQPTASSMPQHQPFSQNNYSQSDNRMNVQPLVPSVQLSSQTATVKKPSTQEKFPVNRSKQSIPIQPQTTELKPATAITSHLMQSLAMKSNITTDNNSASSIQRPLTAYENNINRKLCEIILTIQESKEFVSRERVQRELFNHFHVTSWNELKVQAARFNALMNLTDKQKDVTFYMHVFEQVFNLCTLNDLEPLLAKFLKLEKYEDAQLGPLDKNPEVQRVFKYQPANRDQPIPTITTGEVIQKFIQFQREHRHQRTTPFEEFLDELVEIYNLQSHEELGIFCRSFPYLLQVSGTMRRDQEIYTQEMKEQSQLDFMKDVRARLDELKEKMRDELELSSFNKKKTPTAVFNYLTSIVEERLDFIPQQPVLYAVFALLRDDELLRCLLNVSIYLGTIDKPEVFIAELKQLYGHQESTAYIPGLIVAQQQITSCETMSKKDRKKINAMIQQQQLQLQSSNIAEQNITTNTTPTMPVNTSFASSLMSSHQSKSKPPVSLKQLCSDIYYLLIRYDALLTIKELLSIDDRLCTQHSVPNFSAFNYDENDSDDNPTNFLSFLDKHHRIIDPRGELSVYEQTASADDRSDLYPFVQQLSVINNNDTNEEHQQEYVAPVHGHVNAEQLYMSKEKISAVEKAIKHKFGGTINSRKINQIVKQVKQRHNKHKDSIIRFEESLLDINGLNRLDICPTSLNVNETQLCQLILHCPLMVDLHTWLQWLYFFQPKYGSLKSFIAKHGKEFKELRLLETSTRELFRLPIDATVGTFEHKLSSMHMRSAVGHLCALIMQEGLITRFSFNVYRTSMETWFCHLRYLATIESDQINPMQYILDFLMHLPILIGQSRIIEELVLEPLDKVFGDNSENTINARTRIWNLADAQQRMKLELWGHVINVVEWKNEQKWLECEDFEEKSIIKSENEFIQKQNIDTVNSVVSMTTIADSHHTSTSNTTSIVPTSPIATYTGDENESVQAAFEHIELIRRGFGVNSGLDSTGQLIVTNLQGMIERSLEKLSNDLYSEQGHFVLELIQNADDNQYASGRVPTLRFILSSERILVCNNETGFQPKHIAAICNVGASTKGKHKQGYAGHKGIGFKSVFMVSHRPEIRSGNYRIRFDTVNEHGTQHIGYVRPIWVDQCDEVLPDANEWTTCIRLPIKQEAQGDRLQRCFKDIQARLLLFLNRLRQIEITNQQDISSTNNNTRVFTRIDHADGQIIELQEKNKNETVVSNLWLVVKKVIAVPADIKMKLLDVKGDVDSTTIAIAYPLSGIQDPSSSLPPTQPLFAYLPLRSYGFRFILQADFEIPASRQEIRHDNLWNDWLKTEMTCLLSSAYLQFQRLPELLASSSINTQIDYQVTPIQTIKYFLKLIPSRNELSPYFNSFVDKSIKSLMGIIKLPVSRQNENEETVIDWVSPSQCVIERDPFIRKILPQKLLFSEFNRYYVHEQIVLECDEQILLELGCRPLDFSDITQLIEVSYKQVEQQHPKTTSTIEQIAQWLVCLDYSFQQQRTEMHFDTHHDEKRETETITKLKQLKIIPLRQQSYLVSINEFDEHAIYFPPQKSIHFSKHLKLVLDDVPTLDDQLLDFIEDKYPQRVDSIKKLLRKLGISEVRKIQEIYRQHILPVMSDPTRWSSKSESLLIAYLLCIYESIYLPDRNLSENDLKTLRSKMLIKTRDNKFVSLGSPDVSVHLTSKYGCQMSLEELRLSKFKFTFISDDYWCSEIFRMERGMHSFVAFLKELNLNDFLQVNLINTPFINVTQLVGTQWAHLIGSLSQMVCEPFIIQDFRCEEFDKLISLAEEGQTVDLELCAQLLQYLDKHHQSVSLYYAASVMLARAHKFGHATPIKAIESSFCLALRQHAWIPVVGDKLFKPNEVYLLSSDNQTSAFRRYVPHLNESKVSLHNRDFIFNILGIQQHVSHRMMFELLMKWSCDLDSESLWNLLNQAQQNIIPCTLSNTFRQSCLDTIENFCQIYQFLASHDETRNLLSRFCLWPLIFIPRDKNTGDFLFVHQTFWNDPISLLSLQDTITDSNGRIPIGPYYDNNSTLQTFFLDILHVEFQPTTDDYLPLLSTIQDHNKLWQIIEIITKLATDQNKQPDVREKCLDIPFIPCMNKTPKLVKYTDHPFYPQNTDIANLFADILPIIKLPDLNANNEFKEHFCLLFNIENLDNVIQTKVDVENEQISKNLTDFYSRCIDLIQHFLLSQALIPNTRSIHLASIFARMQFICVDRIDLSYCYGTDVIKAAPNSYSTDTYIDEDSCKFYILKKFETSEMRYIDAMNEFIVEDETARSKLSSYIKKLLQTHQKDAEKEFTQLRERFTENYEPKWTIPEGIKNDVPVLPSIQEEEKIVSEKPVIDAEKIKQLMMAPSLRVKHVPKEVPNDDNTNHLVRFPAGPCVNESNEPASTNPSSNAQMKPKSNDSTERDSRPTSSMSTSNSNDQNHRASEDHGQENNKHEAPKNRGTEHNEVGANRKESEENGTEPFKDQLIQPHGPVIFTDPISLPLPNFEHIAISNLTDLDISTIASSVDESSTAAIFRPIGNEADLITGRQGEALVFLHLKKTYPNETIEWVNKEDESGKPYDIHMIFKSEDNREEFIEVKTTRSSDQNTFPVSIGEVEYLLKHPLNYFIYRVYYAENRNLSTITVLNKIKNNLQLKHLKLSITVISKPSD